MNRRRRPTNEKRLDRIEWLKLAVQALSVIKSVLPWLVHLDQHGRDLDL